MVVAGSLLLSGCSATSLNNMYNKQIKSDMPFFLAYDTEEVILDQAKVATITSFYGLDIDGVEVNDKTKRSANKAGALANQGKMIVDVLPGEYKVKIVYYGQGRVKMEPITYTFEAGRIYDIVGAVDRVVIYENTDADVAQKIKINRTNAKFEKK